MARKTRTKMSTYLDKAGLSGFSYRNLGNFALRILQLIGAIFVIGFYAVDLNAAHKEHKYTDSKWLYAVITGTIAAISAIVEGLLCVFTDWRTIEIISPWDWLVFFFWVVATGIFGKMYFGTNPQMDSGIHRMIVAAGFDCANMILWFATALWGTIGLVLQPRYSLHTGRARSDK